MTQSHMHLHAESDVPGAPVNVRVSSITSSTIGLTWSPPLVSETLRLAISSYATTCSRGPEWDSATHIKTTDGRSAMFSQLAPYTQYNCCVAVNSENGPGKSTCLSVTLLLLCHRQIPIHDKTIMTLYVSLIIVASSGGVDCQTAPSTVLAVFFVVVSVALIVALTALIYFHYKQCILAIKRIIK